MQISLLVSTELLAVLGRIVVILNFVYIHRIEIDIDISERPKDVDPTLAIERLEQIELETKERLERESLEQTDGDAANLATSHDSAKETDVMNTNTCMEDVLSYSNDMWQEIEDLAPTVAPSADGSYNEAAIQSRVNGRGRARTAVSNQRNVTD